MKAIKTVVATLALLLSLSVLCGTVVAAEESLVVNGTIADIDKEVTKLLIGNTWYPIAEDSTVRQVLEQERMGVGAQITFVLKSVAGEQRLISIMRQVEKRF